MLKRYALSLFTAAAIACASLSVSAQRRAIEQNPDMDKAVKAISMTGCVEAAPSSSGPYMLTHVTMADKMSKDSMPPNDKPASDHAGMGDKLNLMGSSVDFSKHVGHKVTVKGKKDGDSFTVKSVKMVATTCP